MGIATAYLILFCFSFKTAKQVEGKKKISMNEKAEILHIYTTSRIKKKGFLCILTCNLSELQYVQIRLTIFP